MARIGSTFTANQHLTRLPSQRQNEGFGSRVSLPVRIGGCDSS